MSYAIEVNNLNFYYHKRHVLKSMNLKIKNKQTTTLIGPSGSGKSTLLRTFNRIYELHAGQKATGEILVHGKDILDNKVNLLKLRARVGMVFQKPTPFAMSIYDNIGFALQLHRKLNKRETDQKVAELLTSVGLYDEVKSGLHRSAFALSGGQQQRLCVARTLATDPDILLLDEPTSSLDPASTQKIEGLINELKKSHTIIMVTHNLQQAKRLGDDTLFMKGGELIEFTNTQDFFNKPQHAQTKEYLDFA